MQEVLPEELAQTFARCFESLTDASEPVIQEYSLLIDGKHETMKRAWFGTTAIRS